MGSFPKKMTFWPFFAFLLLFVAVIQGSPNVCKLIPDSNGTTDFSLELTERHNATMISPEASLSIPMIPIMANPEVIFSNVMISEPRFIQLQWTRILFQPLNIPYHNEPKLSRYVSWMNTVSQRLDLTDSPKVELDPDVNISPQLGGINVERTVSWLWEKQRVEMEKILVMIKTGDYGRLNWTISGELQVIDRQLSAKVAHAGDTPNVARLQQERAEFMKLLQLIELGYVNETYRALKGKLENIIKEAEQIKLILTALKQLSPKELTEVMAKATQRVTQQAQVEKIERLQQIKQEEGAPVLRRTKYEAEDEQEEEIHLLLALLVLWFLLCYCSDGTVWCVDVELTFGLSSVLSEIVLLLSGDIEKNPGPLTAQELAKVDQTQLSKCHLGIVYEAVSSIADRWHQFGVILGLDYSKLKTIEHNYSHANDCLIECLSVWLQESYNYKMYGQPSWQRLTEAVSSIECALAKKIAKNHPVTVTVKKQSKQDSPHHNGFDRSSHFSCVFQEVCRCLEKDIPKAKKLIEFLDHFCHPELEGHLYIEHDDYKAARSTRGVLEALFPTYISATNINLLRCIVKKFGCRTCELVLENYTKEYLDLYTSNSHMYVLYVFLFLLLLFYYFSCYCTV